MEWGQDCVLVRRMVLGVQSTFLGKCCSEDPEQYSHNEEVLRPAWISHDHYSSGLSLGWWSPPIYGNTFHRSWYPSEKRDQLHGSPWFRTKLLFLALTVIFSYLRAVSGRILYGFRSTVPTFSHFEWQVFIVFGLTFYGYKILIWIISVP